MGDVANQDEARKCLEIAAGNMQSGHLEKASRFAEKAMKLYPNDEVRYKYCPQPSSEQHVHLGLSPISLPSNIPGTVLLLS